MTSPCSFLLLVSPYAWRPCGAPGVQCGAHVRCPEHTPEALERPYQEEIEKVVGRAEG